MGPKKASTSTSTPSKQTTTTTAPKSTLPEASLRNSQDAQQILHQIYTTYLSKTPQRTKLLDAFMFFLMVVGVIQFVYCVIAGNYVSWTYICIPAQKKEGWIEEDKGRYRVRGQEVVYADMCACDNSPSTPS